MPDLTPSLLSSRNRRHAATPSLMHHMRKCWHPRRESWLPARYARLSRGWAQTKWQHSTNPSSGLPWITGRARTALV